MAANDPSRAEIPSGAGSGEENRREIRILGLCSLIAWIACLAILFVCFLAVPSFSRMFEDLGQPLPMLTAIVLVVGNFICSPCGAASALFVLAVSVAAYLRWPKRPATAIGFLLLSGLSLSCVPLIVVGLFLPLIRIVETMEK